MTVDYEARIYGVSSERMEILRRELLPAPPATGPRAGGAAPTGTSRAKIVAKMAAGLARSLRD